MTAPFRFPRFFVTNPSPCPYLPGRSERKVFTELSGDNAAELNDALGRIGFRRSQNVAYRPCLHRFRLAGMRGWQQQDGQRQHDQDSRHPARHSRSCDEAQQGNGQLLPCERGLSAPFRHGSTRIGHKDVTRWAIP